MEHWVTVKIRYKLETLTRVYEIQQFHVISMPYLTETPDNRVIPTVLLHLHIHGDKN
jgi:hypothetical protein